jgi:hypothetical protein
MKLFDPHTCQCPACETVLRSRWPGEFVSCECRMSFVDQTEYYSRYGGIVRSLDSLILDDFKAISGIGYEEDDIIEILNELNLETMTSLQMYQLAHPLLGGTSMQQLVEAKRGYKVVALLEALKEGYLP